MLAARLTCDCVQRVFETWAQHFEAELILLDAPAATHLPPRWWELEPVSLARTLRRASPAVHGPPVRAPHRRRWSACRAGDSTNRRTAHLDGTGESPGGILRRGQTSQSAKLRRPPCACRSRSANVMAAQWQRGSEWAVSHARAFRDEVLSRVRNGVAACPRERLRIMWVGAGLWYDLDFYTAFEESHGAVFVWSMYLAFGPDGYIRYGLEDPLVALASRTVSMNEQLHNPPWANEWIVEQAGTHRIDAASRAASSRHASLGHRNACYRDCPGSCGDSGFPGSRGHGGCAALGWGKDAPRRVMLSGSLRAMLSNNCRAATVKER